MKVKCVDNTGCENSLTIGQEYATVDTDTNSILTQNDACYTVKCDLGVLYGYYKTRFKPVVNDTNQLVSDKIIRELTYALQDLAYPDQRTDCNEDNCGHCSTCLDCHGD
jgi:hypothetical protein